MDIIQPLNELADREVKKPEIAKILEHLKNIVAAIKKVEGDLGSSEDHAHDLEKGVNELLEQEKERKIQEAGDKVKDLERSLADLDDLKKDALKKLEEYEHLIDEAKNNEGQDDSHLLGKLT